MNAGVFLCLLFGLIPVAGVLYLVFTGQSQTQRATPLFEALRAFAAYHSARLEEIEVLKTVQVKAHCEVAGEACFVQLGWEHSDFTLRLHVELTGLTQEGFEECWDRDWVRYLKRDYDQRIYVSSTSHGTSLSGPAHSLREVFAEVDRAEMALLFGAPAPERARRGSRPLRGVPRPPPHGGAGAQTGRLGPPGQVQPPPLRRGAERSSGPGRTPVRGQGHGLGSARAALQLLPRGSDRRRRGPGQDLRRLQLQPPRRLPRGARRVLHGGLPQQSARGPSPRRLGWISSIPPSEEDAPLG